jgi:hypothetical protein
MPAVSRASRWALPLLAGVVVGLAGCGTSSPPAGAGQSASVNLSLTTVPTIRSVTVTVPKAQATFGNCSGGKAQANTRSKPNELGFPNGRCWVGALGAAYPITITNTGVASQIDVNGTGAVPSDDITGWSLCNVGDNPAVTCTGRSNNLPGVDQYLVQNFGPYGKNGSGLTDVPRCDNEFDPNGRCWALQNAAGTEGIELTGPFQSNDNSTKWTITITWTPVPP